MDVKEFFYNGGCVKCVDRTESDVVIRVCRKEGFWIAGSHNPNGDYHGVVWDDRARHIGFLLNGSLAWQSGTPFAEWMEQYVRVAKPTPVEDLI